MAGRQDAGFTETEGQDAQTAYHDMLGSIERTMDPNSNTVLVVDDSSLVRKAVVRCIRKTDEKVVILEAKNGLEAIERIAEVREKYARDPLFIMLDLEMPVMDGWEFIEHMRKEYEARGDTQGIPIIVLSSSSGIKGALFRKRSVHGVRAKYSPIATVAKDACLQPAKYDGIGDKGIMAWTKFFLRYGNQ